MNLRERLSLRFIAPKRRAPPRVAVHRRTRRHGIDAGPVFDRGLLKLGPVEKLFWQAGLSTRTAPPLTRSAEVTS